MAIAYGYFSATNSENNVFRNDSTTCPEGIPWIFNWFGDCVDTNRKTVAFALGTISTAMWLFPPFPQLLKNFETKRCDGLSIFFLLFWLAGDSSNALGTLLTHQLVYMRMIGIYYVCVDLTMLSQYFYYTKIYPSRNRLAASPISPTVLLGIFLGGFAFTQRTPENSVPIYSNGRILSDAKINFVEKDGDFEFQTYSKTIGYILGSVASTCCVVSRIPQIVRNWKRASCEGLAPVTFALTSTANCLFIASVAIETTEWGILATRLPWLAGSVACLCFDVTILCQYRFYRSRLAEIESENGNQNETTEDRQPILEFVD